MSPDSFRKPEYSPTQPLGSGNFGQKFPCQPHFRGAGLPTRNPVSNHLTERVHCQSIRTEIPSIRVWITQRISFPVTVLGKWKAFPHESTEPIQNPYPQLMPQVLTFKLSLSHNTNGLDAASSLLFSMLRGRRYLSNVDLVNAHGK